MRGSKEEIVDERGFKTPSFKNAEVLTPAFRGIVEW